MLAKHRLFQLMVGGCAAAAGALLIVNDAGANPIPPPKPGFGVDKVYDIPRLPEPRNKFLNDTADPAVRYNNVSGYP